jgi:YhcH/YjgK/YiaL family protein
MIKDKLKYFRRYIKIRPDFYRAFEFLSKQDLASLPEGKYPIDGEKLFVIVSKPAGKGVKKALLEAHRKYIDIQYVIEGNELIGIKKTSECKNPIGSFDVEKDIIFFTDKSDKYIKLKPGDFAVLFPDDAHAPLSGKTAVRKAVVKVMV